MVNVLDYLNQIKLWARAGGWEFRRRWTSNHGSFYVVYFRDDLGEVKFRVANHGQATRPGESLVTVQSPRGLHAARLLLLSDRKERKAKKGERMMSRIKWIKEHVREFADKLNMKLKPTNAGVMVISDQDNGEKKHGSIVVPNAKDDRPTRTGTVVEVGPGTEDVKQVYAPGNRVIYHKNCGIDVDHCGKTHKIVQPHDIIAVVTEE